MGTVADRGNGVHSGLDTYLRDINDTPLLTAKEENELARRVQEGDSEAREHLIRANLRLVVNIARQYAHRQLDLQDLIEEGNLGLMRAAEGFDPAMHTRFSTYAAFWIRQSLRKLLTDTGKAMHVPAYMAQLIRDWRRQAAHLQVKLHRAPTDEEVARALHLKPRRLHAVKKALTLYDAGPPTGRADEGGLENLIPTPDNTFQSALEHDLATRVVQLLNRLAPREATVVRLRFGLDDQTPRSLEEVGRRLRLTRERVRQIERNALERLLALLEK